MTGPVLIMAGGTGGHIFPGLAVAQELQRRSVPVAWMGAASGMEAELIPRYGIPFYPIDARRLRGQRLVARLLLPLILLRAMFQAIGVVRRLAPRTVLGMGGFAAGPGGLAAWLLRRPLVIHEQNRIPGLTNRLLARLARIVLSGFPDAFPEALGAVYIGNPVREEIYQVEPPERRFGRSEKARLLVLGGSQGALRLNEILPKALAGMAQPPAVCHQVGKVHLERARKAYAEAGVEADVVAFIDAMADAYRQADLVVARAGALTVAELAAVGIGAILVPFPYAVDDHQTRNAEFLADAGAAEIVPEADLTEARLTGRLTELLADRSRLVAMAQAARELATPDAARNAADACLEVAA
ncbi:MAG: undecaprenyldiphospho-muramoylpentapeptide beta-N-acetylglucosaminyltransferase [Xanthomonadales bacterium]|nr:undecaprenyldiphospho-muramoylpentapeptide beta-N-acetylglucosaminyltransferase [Xanthomonadales bacterium]